MPVFRVAWGSIREDLAHACAGSDRPGHPMFGKDPNLRRFVLILGSLSITSLSLVACTANIRAESSPRILLVSLDGGGERLIERMVDRGVMPNLAAIKEQGVQADYALTNFPSKTAAGHASLWTGAYGNVNGITGNSVPLPGGTFLQNRSGFRADALKAEPIWITAAKNGKRVVANQATHLEPLTIYQDGGRFGGAHAKNLTLFDGYSGLLNEDGLIAPLSDPRPASDWRDAPTASAQEFPFRIGESQFWAFVYDDPQDPVLGYDTMLIRPDKTRTAGSLRLKPGRSSAGTIDKFSPPVKVKAKKDVETSVYLRLFEMAPDLSKLTFYRTALVRDQSNRPEIVGRWLQDTGGMVLTGAASLYGNGHFGPTLVDGGQGEAEERFVETVRLMVANRLEKLRYATKSYPWDLTLSYLPYPDGAEHMWYGLLDPESPVHRPTLAPKLWPYMEEICRIVDGYIGEMRAIAGTQGHVVVVSDHGMEGVGWDFLPNVALREAGLLELTEAGTIDLRRSAALYSPNDGGYVVINRASHGGVVLPKDVPAVKERVILALSGLKAPDGRRLVTAVYDAAQADSSLGIGGPEGGDLYLDILPGYLFHPQANAKTMIRPRPALGSGGHVFNPARPTMHAIFYAAGPAFKQGVVIPPVRTIDVAPTLSRLLGIPAPADARGRVITEALKEAR